MSNDHSPKHDSIFSKPLPTFNFKNQKEINEQVHNAVHVFNFYILWGISQILHFNG